LDKPDVVLLRVNPQLSQTFQIQRLNVVRRRLQHDLILIVVLHAIRILAVSPIRWTPAWLGIGGTPGLWAKGAEERGWMKGTRPHLQIVGLMNDAALLGPVVMQCENEILEGHEQSSRGCGGLNSRDRQVEMNGEANRNAQDLSRNNPSRIKELQRVTPMEIDGHCGSNPLKYSAQILRLDS
jgi:hypothetical protein